MNFNTKSRKTSQVFKYSIVSQDVKTSPKPGPSEARFRHQARLTGAFTVFPRISKCTLKTWVAPNPYNQLGRHLVWKLKLAIRTGRVGPGPATFQNVPTPMRSAEATSHG